MKFHKNLITCLFLLFSALAYAGDFSALRKKLQNYTDGIDATVGIAVITAEGDSLTINNRNKYPMMSVFKFHQALGVAHYMKQKGLSLNMEVEIKAEELKLKTWSPLRDKYPDGTIMTVGELLSYTLQWSDNLACDILFDRFYSPSELESFIKSCGIDDVNIRYNEAQMVADNYLSYDNWTSPYDAALLVNK